MRSTHALALLFAGMFFLGCAQSSGQPNPPESQDALSTPEAPPAPEDVSGLYPFPEGPLWGYIDGGGNIRIKPRFRAAGQFSSGLAPVREGGLYGYIDSTGAWAIQPQFDLAMPFAGGTALVYPAGRPALLQRDGSVIAIRAAKTIRPSGAKDVWIVQTFGGREALLSSGGQWLTDSVFDHIEPFESGLAAVKGWQAPQADVRPAPDPPVGVIDAAGRWVVPLHKYRDITVHAGGYMEAWPKDRNDEVLTVYYLQRDGKLLFTDTVSTYRWIVFEQAGDGVLPVRFNQRDGGNIMGLLSTKRELLFKDSRWQDLTAYAHGVSLTSGSRYGDSLMLVDKRGNPVVSTVFSGAAFPPSRSVYKPSAFVDGTAVVLIDDRVALIDTAGRVLKTAPTSVLPDDHRSLERRGNVVLFAQSTLVGDEEVYRYGFWNLRTDAVAKAAYKSVDPDAFPDGLIPAYDADDRLVYLNENGRKIFQAPRPRPMQNAPLNVAVMNRGYFYASGPAVANSRSLGGYGGSQNAAEAIGRVEWLNATKPLFLRIDSATQALPKYDCLGHSVVLANTSFDTMFFDAQDSRLYAVLQAKDASGAWRDIEYLPSSWCGNSYHTLALPPQHQWKFSIPHYEGSTPVAVRVKLSRAGKDAEKPTGEYFSNEVPMSINPGQYWSKGSYTPAGIMDPYND